MLGDTGERGEEEIKELRKREAKRGFTGKLKISHVFEKNCPKFIFSL